MNEKRWTVQRAGVKGHYMPGWFALCEREMGEAAWFPTWKEAQAFAMKHASLELRADVLKVSLSRWGLAATHRAPRRIGSPVRTRS